MYKGGGGYLYNLNWWKINYIGSQPIRGDVNADGKLSSLDVIMMQKWLLNIPNAKLTDWKAGDLHENGKINAFDLGLLRHLLLNQK